MEKNNKKTFTVLEKDLEEKYIEDMAKDGFLLIKVDQDGHYFEKSQPIEGRAIIEYFADSPPNEMYYQNKGLDLITSLKGSKGYWNYYFGIPSEEIVRRKDDYHSILKMISKRYEIFWTIIPMTLSLFGAYMFVNNRHPLNLIIIILPLILIYKIRGMNKEIKEKIKREEEV